MPIVQPRSAVICSPQQMTCSLILSHLRIVPLQTSIHSVFQVLVVVFGPSRQDAFSFPFQTPYSYFFLLLVVVTCLRIRL